MGSSEPRSRAGGGGSAWLKCGLLRLLATLDRVRPRRDILPVLNYHGIDEDCSPVSLPPGEFAIQMEILAERDYRVIPFREALDFLARPDSLPERTAALTFDDGLESVFTAALPAMRRHGFRGTVFLVTGAEGNRVSWEREAAIRPRRLLEAAQVSELVDNGFEIGAHTRSHPHLTELSDEELDLEGAGSRDDVAARAGRAPETFAYPYGDHDDRVVASVRRAGFSGACTVRPPGRRMGRDLYRVERFDTSRFSGHGGAVGELFFLSCLNGVFADYLRIKMSLPWFRAHTFEYRENSRKQRHG